jgi:serine/threonine protein kinase
MMHELLALVNPEDMSNLYERIDDSGARALRENTFVARSLENDELVQIACIPIQNSDSSLLPEFSRTLRQLQVTRRISHEDLLEFRDSFISGSQLWIVHQYVEGVFLSELLKVHGALPEEVLAGVCFKICQALQYLHSNQIVHRSIKSPSVLITKSGAVKLVNFEYASPYPCADSIPSTHWTAPEVLDSQSMLPASRSQPPSVDIWALGVMCLEAIGQNTLFEQPPERTIETLRIEGPSFNMDSGRHMRGFIEKCLSLDPDVRPSAGRLLEHPFLQQRSVSDSLIALISSLASQSASDT